MAAGDLVGKTGLVRVVRLMCNVLSTLLTLLLLLWYSFVGALSLSLMYFKGIRSKGFTQSRWDALLRSLGVLFVVMVLVVVYLFPSSLGQVGHAPDVHGFFK